MARGVLRLLSRLLAGANIATIIAMLVAGYADNVSPASHPSLGTVGLAYPVVMCINLAFLLWWCFFKLRYVWIPVVGFLLCYQPTRNYFPLNLPKQVPEGAIKVLSYNVWYFADPDKQATPNPIVEYIRHQDADIVCLQEAAAYGVSEDQIDQTLSPLYPHSPAAFTKEGNDRMAVYSKFPIIKKERIEYVSNGNHSHAFFLDVDGDTVIVINNHLESTGFDDQDKASFKGIVKGDITGETAKGETKQIIRKLRQAAAVRARQADAVAQYIKAHEGTSMIVCGDFNDGPNSYTRNTIAKQLRDAYVETANGPGISYHLGGFYVRIDQLMCSKDFTPYSVRVDNSINTSDHYPIYGWLKKAPKP